MTQATLGVTAFALLVLLQGFGTNGSGAAEVRSGATLAKPACDVTKDDCEPPPDPGEKCAAVVSGPPPGTGRFSCQFTITDAYGRPAQNTPVRVETRWCNKRGSKVLATASGVTDANGALRLLVSSRSPNVIACALDFGAEPLFHGATSAVRKSNTKLPIGTSVALATQLQPAPNATRTLAGLDAGAGRMDLYQSGAYDKVLVIAEQFDQREHGPFPLFRERSNFWKQLSPLLLNLFGNGWDVWLMQPHDTGESLHEQAAEFAQAVAAAAATLPAGPLCQSPTVGVLGFNTGGLVARIATARWEDDPAWRTQLGLPAALPVKFIATFDAPHYGMHLNLDMQKSLWKNKSGSEIRTETNLDSCAASQMLRGRYDPVRDKKTNEDFLAFFVDGTPTRFFAKQENVERTCVAGPPVATLNAARGVPGWPSKPVRIGFAQSHPDDLTKCFDTETGNQNGSLQNLCKHVTELCARFECLSGGSCFCAEHVAADKPFAPSAGQTWMRIFKDDPSLPDFCPDEFWDAEDRAEWSDIVAGSRSPIFLDGFIGSGSFGPIFCKATAHQRYPTTLVPFVSAAGTQGPGASSPYMPVASPFNEMHPAARSRVADVINVSEGSELIGRLNAFPPGCTPPVVNPN